MKKMNLLIFLYLSTMILTSCRIYYCRNDSDCGSGCRCKSGRCGSAVSADESVRAQIHLFKIFYIDFRTLLVVTMNLGVGVVNSAVAVELDAIQQRVVEVQKPLTIYMKSFTA